MSIGKRPGVPRYMRKAVVARQTVRITARTTPVLIRTVAFVPAYLRKRPH